MSQTGKRILRLAREHIGEKYHLGTVAPKNNKNWRGPWDCAELASWLVYQVSERLYGCDRRFGDPASADAYTGFWGDDARDIGEKVTVATAAGIEGAAVLREPSPGRRGHIVISNGQGGTVEAHSTNRGVIEHTLDNRRWDCGILVPGIDYGAGDDVPVEEPPQVLRYTTPMMTGTLVKKLQVKLKELGFDPGPKDGKFGPMTEAAVIAFQLSESLVVDGEVGPETARALEIEL
jgi:hypothetical protein